MWGEDLRGGSKGFGVSLGARKCTNSDYDDGYTTLNVLKTTESHTFRGVSCMYVSYVSIELLKIKEPGFMWKVPEPSVLPLVGKKKK